MAWEGVAPDRNPVVGIRRGRKSGYLAMIRRDNWMY